VSDLNEISEAIGGLRARVESLANEQEHARGRHEKIFEKLEDLKQGQQVALRQHTFFADAQAVVAKRLDAAELHIEDYKKLRSWGAAIWTGTAAVAGVIGWLASSLGDLWRKVL
jgi:chromosome segregation ATPase